MKLSAGDCGAACRRCGLPKTFPTAIGMAADRAFFWMCAATKPNISPPTLPAPRNSIPLPENTARFPGPNSNTFTAWIAREVPQLGLKLPLRAVGKSYLRFASR